MIAIPKFKLKSEAELLPRIAERKLFVLSCGKCFRPLSDEEAGETEAFLGLAGSCGASILGCAQADFLCNRQQTEALLTDAIPQDAEILAVCACGIGVQTAAAVCKRPVLAVCDSVGARRQRGMMPGESACDACGQCFLNETGGICPLTACTKGLLNGPCGGGNGGKCEADPRRDCGWEIIFRRLRAQGRLGELLARPVLFRDYGTPDPAAVRSSARRIRALRAEGFPGGFHPDGGKEPGASAPLLPFPPPERVVLPLRQHSDAPAIPIVSVGDYVRRGQCIAEADGAVSARVHASVSGVVEAIEPRLHPVSGVPERAVILRSDGRDTPADPLGTYDDLSALSPADICAIAERCGIVGMGGAAFPTAVKLRPGKPVDTVVANGCECEPLLTADHKLFRAYGEDVLFGLRAAMKAVGAARGILAIEDNKPDAIARMEALISGESGISVAAVAAKYPQGAEKLLVKRVLHRDIPSGGLPADVGTVVCNAATLKAISDGIRRGLPLTERIVTVSGTGLARPGNYLVRIGTCVEELLTHCGLSAAEKFSVRMGGPMMGIPLSDRNVPVLKATNGIVVTPQDLRQQEECIRCGRCADVCPMGLAPLYLARAGAEKDPEALSLRRVNDCMECRCCEVVCPSRVALLDGIRSGKRLLQGRN